MAWAPSKFNTGRQQPTPPMRSMPSDYFYGAGALPQRGGTGTWTQDLRVSKPRAGYGPPAYTPEYFMGGGPYIAFDRATARRPGARVMAGAALLAPPGSVVELYQVTFDYTGPPRGLRVGWAAKPSTGGLFGGGTNFNNGANTIPAARAFSSVFGVPGPGSITQTVSARFTVPAPGNYTLEGGGTGGISADQFDTWAWILDWDQLQMDGLSGTESDSMVERYILAIDSSYTPQIRLR